MLYEPRKEDDILQLYLSITAGHFSKAATFLTPFIWKGIQLLLASSNEKKNRRVKLVVIWADSIHSILFSKSQLKSQQRGTKQN